MFTCFWLKIRKSFNVGVGGGSEVMTWPQYECGRSPLLVSKTGFI